MKIPSGSMEKTIMTGDRLIGNRLAYTNGRKPKRGDIAVFRYPVDEKELFIKRVIGEPGDTVKIKDGFVWINGKKLLESYTTEKWGDEENLTFKVPKNCYFMMGDNRNNSLDGRYWAEEALTSGLAKNEKEASKYSFVSKDKFVAKASFRIGLHPDIYKNYQKYNN